MSPTIVIIPGSWHTAAAFEALCTRLDPLWTTFCVSLPSTNDPNPERINLSDDIAYLRDRVFLPLLSDGTDLVLLMHSYGAVPGSAAAKGLSPLSSTPSPPQQQRDIPPWPTPHRGHILGLIYLSGYLIKEGTTFYESLNSLSSSTSSSLACWRTASPDYTTVPPPPAHTYLYHALTPDVATAWAAALRPHALHTLGSIVPYAAWARPEWRERRVYIATRADRVNPLEAQRAMCRTAGIERERVVEVETGHAPFITDLDTCADAVVSAMQTLGFGFGPELGGIS